MIVDALNVFQWTSATGMSVATSTTDGFQRPSITATATYTSQAFDTVDLGWGVSNPMFVKVQYYSATNGTGTSVATFVLQKSADNTTWYDFVSDAQQAVTFSGATVLHGYATLPFSTQSRYQRLAVYVTGTGSSPAITLLAFVGEGPL